VTSLSKLIGDIAKLETQVDREYFKMMGSRMPCNTRDKKQKAATKAVTEAEAKKAEAVEGDHDDDDNNNETTELKEGSSVVAAIQSIHAQTKAIHAFADKRASDLIAKVHTIKDRNVKILKQQKHAIQDVLHTSKQCVDDVESSLQQQYNNHQWILEHQNSLLQQLAEQSKVVLALNDNNCRQQQQQQKQQQKQQQQKQQKQQQQQHQHQQYFQICGDLIHVVKQSHAETGAIIASAMGDIFDLRCIDASYFAISIPPQSIIDENCIGIVSKVSKVKIVSTRNDEKVEDMIKSDKIDMKSLLEFSVNRVDVQVAHIQIQQQQQGVFNSRGDSVQSAIEQRNAKRVRLNRSSSGNRNSSSSNDNNDNVVFRGVEDIQGVEDEQAVLLFQPFELIESNDGSGLFEVCYGIGEIGTFEIAVTWRGRHIQNSPFRVKIENQKIIPRPVVPHFGTGKLNGPADVHFTKGDKIFVSNWDAHNISVFNRSDLSFITSFGSLGDEDGWFNRPLGMASYGDKLYVADRNNDRICVFKQSDYSFVTSFGGYGVLSCPQFLCVSEVDQRLYVTDDKGIISFNLNDHSLRKRFKISIDNAHGICLSPNGSSLYVAEFGKHRVVEVDIEMDKIIRSVGREGQGNGQFIGPVGVCLSADGEYVLVSEQDKNRISVFKTSDLSFVKHIGSKGDEANQLNSPYGCYCDENCTIFVADWDNHRVTILNL
jgi:DNA-binding beta-propeller fold protein YncE